VVVDDLFVSPLDIPTSFVAGRLTEEPADARFTKVSGVFMLNPVVYPDKEVQYRAFFVQGKGKPLPDSVNAAFLDENARFEVSGRFRD